MIPFNDSIQWMRSRKVGGYLILPKFLFKDRTMLTLIRHLELAGIKIFHTHKAFDSNSQWKELWSDPSFRSSFRWGLVYTLPDLVIGAGCFQEIDAFRKANLPLLHVHFDQRYIFSNVTGLSQPFENDDWSRYAKVLIDDKETIGPLKKQTSRRERQEECDIET
jgi:hypothetical protein